MPTYTQNAAIEYIEFNDAGEIVTVTRPAVVAKYAWENDPDNPDAYPLMRTLNLFGGWAIEEWMTWHDSMKRAHGLTTANARFLTAWADDGAFSGPPLQERNFNTAFRDYAKANGFFEGLFPGLGAISKPIGAATDVIDSASKAVTTTAKAAEWLIPAAALVAVAILAAPHVAPHLRRAKKSVAEK